MGDPKKNRKKYKTPAHPWRRERIESEVSIIRNYGLRRKKEIMIANSELKRITSQVKKLIRERIKGSAQVAIEEKQLLDRLYNLKLIEKDVPSEKVLDLSLFDILERRLQTVVFKKGLAKSLKQARQFILHGHISIDGQKIDVPSLLVQRNLEDKITFNPTSTLSDPANPERIKERKRTKAEIRKQKEQEAMGDEFKEVLKEEIVI